LPLCYYRLSETIFYFIPMIGTTKKISFPCLILLSLMPGLLYAQTAPLLNFEAVLVGPENTDRHHPVQIEYYKDYYIFLSEEVDIWLGEVNQELRTIKRRNRKRIKKKKPIKLKDYPKWKQNRELIKSLEKDKILIKNYIEHWENYDTRKDSVMADFQLIYDPNRCFDLITADIVLSKEEYSIDTYEAPPDYFDWNEFTIRQKGNCPDSYMPQGKTCVKNIEVETTFQKPPVYTILNLLQDIPVHLDGYKEVSCDGKL